jgi:excisionase family DNA binding protein
MTMNDGSVTMAKATAEVPRLLLTPKEAARALGLCEKTLWCLTDPRGAIRCVRIGRAVRYDPRDLSAWIEKAKGEESCGSG